MLPSTIPQFIYQVKLHVISFIPVNFISPEGLQPISFFSPVKHIPSWFVSDTGVTWLTPGQAGPGFDALFEAGSAGLVSHVSSGFLSGSEARSYIGAAESSSPEWEADSIR